MELEIGQIVRMKKPHPCGANLWEVIRLGADIRIKCLKCERSVMIPRARFEKRMKKKLTDTEVKEALNDLKD